jgi:cytochrome oxidase assembly protein ShyY1
VAPFYLDLIDSIPPIADTAPLPTPLPTLDDGPHLSYAVQWFIFSIAVVVGWVLAVRKSIDSRRRQLALTDEADEPAPADSHESSVDASATTST